jgi:U3 small nucleolar RNA-associated protein 5
VYVWLIRPKGDAAVDAQQVARLAVDPQHKQEAILAAALEHTPVGATLVVAVGSAAKPRFERVPMGTTAVKSSKITFLQPPPSTDGLIRPAAAAAAGAKQGVAAAAAGSGGKGAAAAEVIGADNAGELVQQRQSKSSKKRSEPDPDNSEQQQQQDGDDDALLANGVDGMMDTDEEQELSGEPTLGQRVLQLEKQQQQQQCGLVQAAAAEAAAGDAAAGDASAALPAGPLKADSLAVLLSQALRSSDRALLERCLSVGRERVIVNSVKRLVPMDAALLLKAAVERLQTKPSRGQQLAAWIHAVLLQHTGYLMSAPAAAPLMSSLYQIIEARLAMQRQLLSLSGRLDLLLAQRGPAADGAGAVGAAGAPVAQVRVLLVERLLRGVVPHVLLPLLSATCASLVVM